MTVQRVQLAPSKGYRRAPSIFQHRFGFLEIRFFFIFRAQDETGPPAVALASDETTNARPNRQSRNYDSRFQHMIDRCFPRAVDDCLSCTQVAQVGFEWGGLFEGGDRKWEYEGQSGVNSWTNIFVFFGFKLLFVMSLLDSLMSVCFELLQISVMYTFSLNRPMYLISNLRIKRSPVYTVSKVRT